MAEDDRLRFALTLIKDRLHKAVGDKRCGCGQCSHWIAVAARRSGVTRERLEAPLPPPAKPELRRSRPARRPAGGLALLLKRLTPSRVNEGFPSASTV